MGRMFLQPKCITVVFIALVILSTTTPAQEGSSDSWNKAQAEMKAMFGTVPVMFNKMPVQVRVSAWNWFKATDVNPNSVIPAKYSELIGLAVAAQIPCEYCVYAHTTLAKMFGATDEEIKAAVESGASTRHWSTVLNGNQIDYKEFKTEWDAILAFMKANKKKKD
jgi:AhpD family alkylhydroperoxidase